MNKPNEYESKFLPLDQLIDCPLNDRPVDPDAQDIRDLGASLLHRQEVDLIVRPTAGGRYEVLDGKRRHYGARWANIPALWCQVREGCTDAEALQIIIVTQLHRKGLDPLGEAALLARLLESGQTMEVAAAELGRPVTWVARRAKLTQLAPVWREGIAAGKFPWATVAHLEHVALLPQEVQREIAAAYGGDWQAPDSMAGFVNEIRARYLHQLKAAPWKLDDLALLPTAGPCTLCPKRSGQQQVLFADTTDAADRCTDAVCWSEKLSRHNDAKARQLAGKHEKIIVLTQRGSEGEKAQPAPADLPAQAVVLTTSLGLEDCRKGDEGALPVLDAETGKQSWAKVANYAPPATREALGLSTGKPAKDASDGPAVPAATAAQKREVKRLAWRLEQIAEALTDADPPPLKALLPIYAAFAVGEFDPKHRLGWAEAGAEHSDNELAHALWDHLVGRLRPQLLERLNPLNPPDVEAIAVLEDLATLRPSEQEAKALAEVPEPKGKAAP